MTDKKPRPDMLVVPNERWRDHFNEHRRNPPWYVRLGIYPGEFEDRKNHTLHVKRSVYRTATVRGKLWAQLLIAHGYGHLMGWPLEDHAGNVWQRFRHAIQVRFDVRASNRLFRRRRGDPRRWREARRWIAATLPRRA